MSDDAAVIAYLKSKVPTTPDLGIICGSGLGELHSLVTDRTVIKYDDIPGFPSSTVAGHKSELVCGKLGGKNVILMRGRFHYYEGYPPKQVAVGVRAMAALGVKMLIVTNASGGVNPSYNIGDFMILEDHMSFGGLAGLHPLVGHNDDRYGPRFPAVAPSYDKDLQALLESTAIENGLGGIIRRGVYCGVSGPSYETPAEIDMLRTLGGDAVGMSTVFEIISAAHVGLPLVAVALVSNRCKGRRDSHIDPTHQEVLDSVKARTADMQRLIEAFVTKLDLDSKPRTKAFDVFSTTTAPSCPCGATCPCGPTCGCGDDCKCGTADAPCAFKISCPCGASCPCGPTCSCGDDCKCGTADAPCASKAGAGSGSGCCGSKSSKSKSSGSCPVGGMMSCIAASAVAGALAGALVATALLKRK